MTLEYNGNGTAALYGGTSNAKVGSHPVILVVTDTYAANDFQEFNIVVEAPPMGALKITKVFDPLTSGFT